MSWFKKTLKPEMQNSNCSPDEDVRNGRRRHHTDPDLCFEVFKNHWHQAWTVIEFQQKNQVHTSRNEDFETVIHNFEQMVNLLVDEEGIEGMPGPILHYLLEHDVINKFCIWCYKNYDLSERLLIEQLRMFELMISQAKQLLLIHKSVIRPLLSLLSWCGNEDKQKKPDIEQKMILVLHQLCVCLSQETMILESFFCINADQGPAKFLIFSLLIPYIHREGRVGQQARDALLLIMSLSAKHPHIGKYVAENSDFCPVLATGLSGLYSSLPLKIHNKSGDWFQITEEDIAETQEIQMFLNSLEFCNAVAQIAHPSIRDQLIDYIYNGFLVPVLGPALHQDVSGLPLPLLESPFFARCKTLEEITAAIENSRDEVITATAYLELFLRRITEPVLIRAFLSFILLEKHDEIVILDSLITRINGSSKLCLVSLSLFKTLVELNCEDAMFQLIFKYLVPCNHVMVSQRRSFTDTDMYSKSAEKFLSLRPTCCVPDFSDSPKLNNDSSPSSSSEIGSTPVIETASPETNKAVKPKRGFSRFRSRGRKNKLPPVVEVERRHSIESQPKSNFPYGSYGSKLDHFETSYNEYLSEARQSVESCALACLCWSATYDGDSPHPDSVLHLLTDVLDRSEPSVKRISFSEPTVKRISFSDDLSSDSFRPADNPFINSSLDSSKDTADTKSDTSIQLVSHGNIGLNDSRYGSESSTIGSAHDSNISQGWCHSSFSDGSEYQEESKPSSISKQAKQTHLDDVDSFIKYLNSSEISVDGNETTEEIMLKIDELVQQLTDSLKHDSVSAECEENSATKQSAVSLETCDISEISPELDSVAEEKNSLTVISGVDTSSYVEITMTGLDGYMNKSGVSSHRQQTDELSSSQLNRSKPRSASAKEERGHSSSLLLDRPRSLTELKSTGPPNIGPFLTGLLGKLESMMQNSFQVNLLLTGLLSRLATYPQPLLRSFLLNHNLVFQPTVKSLIQVLSTVRQKVDHYSYAVPNFEQLLLRARRTLAIRDGSIDFDFKDDKLLQFNTSMVMTQQTTKPLKSPTITEIQTKEKRKSSLTDLLFKRSPTTVKTQSKNSHVLTTGYKYVSKRQEEIPEAVPLTESVKTRNAVYCALVLEEFVKELASLAQEHSVLRLDEGYYSN